MTDEEARLRDTLAFIGGYAGSFAEPAFAGFHKEGFETIQRVVKEALQGETVAAFIPKVISRDPRDPDHSRSGIFVHHNCWKCDDGEKPCVRGNSNQCDYPHARND